MAKYKNVELLDCMILSNKSDEFCEGVRFALEEVDKLPAADVVEVKQLTESLRFAIDATNIDSEYNTGLRNGLRLALSYVDGKEPQFEKCAELEVVRCKDCIYRYTKYCNAKHERADMDYCSHGKELKNNENS